MSARNSQLNAKRHGPVTLVVMQQGKVVKRWQELTISDFEIQNPDWIPSLQAVVIVTGAEVTLMVDDKEVVDQQTVEAFALLLADWQSRLSETASYTQEYLQSFLPGRTVSPSEIKLWGLTIYHTDGKANSASFHYNVTGEYDGESYRLDEFDSESVVEFRVPIAAGEFEWSNHSIAATNDFD